MDIGNKIKKLRNLKKLTQEQLANKCNLSKNAIWNYENNKRSPDIKTLNNIAEALGTTIDNFLTPLEERTILWDSDPDKNKGLITKKYGEEEYKLLKDYNIKETQKHGVKYLKKIHTDNPNKLLRESIDIAYNTVRSNSKPPKNLHSVVFNSLSNYLKEIDTNELDQLKNLIDNITRNLYELLRGLSNKNNIELSEPQISDIILKVYDLIDFEIFKGNRNDKK